MAAIRLIVGVLSLVAVTYSMPQGIQNLNLVANSIDQDAGQDVAEFHQADDVNNVNMNVSKRCDGSENDLFPYPLHASCAVEWHFGVNCSEVLNRLLDQIDLWSGPENCEGGGEKCLYKVKSSGQYLLRGSHATPVAMYVDNFFFTFRPGFSGCYSKSYSYSTVSYAVLDYGTNYCNMFNLVDGSGLNKEPKFFELTCNKICTQYTTADCEVYRKK